MILPLDIPPQDASTTLNKDPIEDIFLQENEQFDLDKLVYPAKTNSYTSIELFDSKSIGVLSDESLELISKFKFKKTYMVRASLKKIDFTPNITID